MRIMCFPSKLKKEKKKGIICYLSILLLVSLIVLSYFGLVLCICLIQNHCLLLKKSPANISTSCCKQTLQWHRYSLDCLRLMTQVKLSPPACNPLMSCHYMNVVGDWPYICIYLEIAILVPYSFNFLLHDVWGLGTLILVVRIYSGYLPRWPHIII